MRLPPPPANAVTTALEQAADQVVDAAEQVVETLIGTAEGATDPASLRVVQKALTMAKTAKEEARDRVVADIHEGVGRAVESTTAAVVAGTAVVLAAAGIALGAGMGAAGSASRLALDVARVAAVVIAYSAVRAAAEGVGAAQRLRKESAALGSAFNELQAEIRRLPPQVGIAIDATSGQLKAARDNLLRNFEQVARLLADAAATTAGGIAASGGATPGASIVRPGDTRHLERINRLADKLKGHALRQGSLPPVVRAQLIDVCTPLPRLGRPDLTPRAMLPVSPMALRKPA